LLSELGHEPIVAHARSVRLIGESRRKDDRIDARTLARLVRIDPELLCPVKHRSAEAQADLTVIRARAALVRTRTMLVNAARGLTKSYGERLRGCNARGMKPQALRI
jgi:transposase